MRAEQITSSISTGWLDLAAAFPCFHGKHWIGAGRLAVPHIPGNVKHFRIHPYPASRRYKRR